MNSTENYHLNQWEATDRVLRQDFNADNVKIDAALEEIRTQSSLILLNEWILDEDTAEKTWSIEINWNNWKIVHIQMEAFTADDRTDVVLSLGSTEILHSCGNLKNTDNPYLGYSLLFPWYDARRTITYFYTNGYTDNSFGVNTSSRFNRYADYLRLRVYSNKKALAGTKITLWGEK